ncbi:hypothetical protein [Protofrankia sp. BMG5.30]|uniref:Tocopherol cyclase n=1 Tax=Protofrankia coriariae TaxID=1562887 RepID=A0ABR5F0F5_9ACTN|nr:hypothetical protein [Protofrankia sp. BMG5.30]KLL10185.1 hypothetical protein FrCorBMG51_19655 [Protofrankia coriariae]ONH34622.1 hypothetical protein BL254_15445 [Protofrankia sp. BMG5.30]
MNTPLVPLDDEFVHSTPYPVSHPPTSASNDPRFFERYWNVWHDDTGDLLLAVGGSCYPVLGRVESYAIVNFRGDHRSVRSFRPLSPEPADLTVGPIRPTILAGLHRWRHVLEPGEWGFSYDLEWTDTRRPTYGAAWGPQVQSGERQVTAGFESFGQVAGWIQVGGTRVDWAPGQAHGTRDRHWGVGRGVGGPALNGGRVHRPGWKGGIWIDLHDVGLWGRKLLYGFDDPRPGSGSVHRIERRLRFEPDTHLFLAGVIDLTFDDGAHRSLRLERLGNQTAFMRCGFYGGTPGAGLHPGAYKGPERTEWDRFDVNDPHVRLALRGLDEHHCAVIDGTRATTGILQPVEPDAYEACREGRPGWALW